MLSLFFDAVFRGVRQAGWLVEHGQLVRTRMIIKRISAILRHCFVLLAVRLDIKPRKPAAAPTAQAPATARRRPTGNPSFPLWLPVPLHLRHPAFAAGEAPGPNLRPWALSRSLLPGLCVWPPDDDGAHVKTLERKLAGLRAALLNPMPFVRRLARKLRSDAIILKPSIPRTIPKTSEREFWDERVAAALEARHALTEYWRNRRDSS